MLTKKLKMQKTFKNMDNKITKEEMDILELLDLFTNWVLRTFKKSFNLFIDFLFYLKRNFILFIAIIILYLSYSFIFKNDNEIKPYYETSIILKPNFGSEYMLYSKIEKLNSLIINKDFDLLSKELNISINDALYINNISIQKLLEEKEEKKEKKEKAEEKEKLIHFLHKVSIITNNEIDYEKIKYGILNSCDNDMMLTRQNTYIANLKDNLNLSKEIAKQTSNYKDTNTKTNNNQKSPKDLINLLNLISYQEKEMEEYRYILYPFSFETIKIVDTKKGHIQKKSLVLSIIFGISVLYLKDFFLFLVRENQRRKNI